MFQKIVMIEPINKFEAPKNELKYNNMGGINETN